jgi:hypothetical protein
MVELLFLKYFGTTHHSPLPLLLFPRTEEPSGFSLPWHACGQVVARAVLALLCLCQQVQCEAGVR